MLLIVQLQASHTWRNVGPDGLSAGTRMLHCMLQRLCTAAQWIRTPVGQEPEPQRAGEGKPGMGSDSAVVSGLGQGNGVRSIVLMWRKCGMAMQSEQAAAWPPMVHHCCISPTILQWCSVACWSHAAVPRLVNISTGQLWGVVLCAAVSLWEGSRTICFQKCCSRWQHHDGCAISRD